MWHLQASTRSDDVVPTSHNVGHMRTALARLLDPVGRHLKAFVKPTEVPNIRTAARERKSGVGTAMLGISEINPPQRHK